MQPATKNADQKQFNDERLLTRLSETWWRTRTGSPGFHWILAREALSYPKVQAALAELNWRPDVSDKELYAAFLGAVSKDNFKAPDFDSWEIGQVPSGKWTMTQRAEQRKREASRVRKHTAPPAAAAAPKAKPSKAREAPGAWPVLLTAPPKPKPSEAPASSAARSAEVKDVSESFVEFRRIYSTWHTSRMEGSAC